MNYLGLLLAALLLLSGCGVTQETDTLSQRQVLVKVSPLPPCTPGGSSGTLSMRVGFRVLGDGTIAEVNIVRSRADATWNATAAELMRQWRFSPLAEGGDPEGRWIQYSLVVHVEEPIVMALGEIVADGRQEADSLYELLDNDVPFDSIAKQGSAATSVQRAKFLGTVDIATYPQHVRNELRRLRANQFTHPLKLGDHYVIYVRFREEASGDLVQ